MPDEHERLVIPSASWDMIKKIITAYDAVKDEDHPSVETVAELAGKPRTLISGCNSFLRSIGILRSDENKLTQIGANLAIGISHGNESVVNEALEQVVRDAPQLARLIAIVRARGSLKVDALRGAIIVAAGLGRESRNVVFVKTILDLLADSGLIMFDEDMVILRRPTDRIAGPAIKEEVNAVSGGSSRSQNADSRADDLPVAPKGYIPTPFPLGPNRLAYLSLPGDWDPRELPKLLKMIELAFGSEQ